MKSDLFKKVQAWYQKDCKIIAASLFIGMSAMALTAFAAAGYAEETQSGIADEVIRFHVLANSDAECDQLLKLKVRDAIIEDMQSLLTGKENLEETRDILTQNLDRVEKCAENIIEEEGYNYSVSAKITADFFPTKIYGDAAFPAGMYEALRVEIGEGKGKNWWCLMFPPLCFVDVTQANLPETSKQELRNVLTDEEYSVIMQSQSDSSELPFKTKFKIIEIWQKLKNSFL